MPIRTRSRHAAVKANRTDVRRKNVRRGRGRHKRHPEEAKEQDARSYDRMNKWSQSRPANCFARRLKESRDANQFARPISKEFDRENRRREEGRAHGMCISRSFPLAHPSSCQQRRLAPLIPAAISIILGGAPAPPYNIIIYAREGSLIRAPRACKMADHVNAPLIFRDLARPPASKWKCTSPASPLSVPS